eukprot:gene2782-5479_t
MLGECTVGNDELSAHDSAVNALVIDDRSRYLLSADASGCILVWRTDDISMQSLSITSLTISPDRSSFGQLLVLALPSTLRLYNLSTYRVHTNYPGVNLGETFGRAQLSADGRIAVCGYVDSYGAKLKFWDAQMGDAILARLSVRGISWHPKQHMIAVTMLGTGASLLIYSAEKENVQLTAARQASAKESKPKQSHPYPDHASLNASASASQLGLGLGPGKQRGTVSSSSFSFTQRPRSLAMRTSVDQSADSSTSWPVDTATAGTVSVAGVTGNMSMSHFSQWGKSPSGGRDRDRDRDKESIKELRAQKSKEILDKIKALRNFKPSNKSSITNMADESTRSSKNNI